MKETRVIMGMPITVEIADTGAQKTDVDAIFDYFDAVDKRFSTYKQESEISRINRGEITEGEYSAEMREIFALAEETKRETNGFFDIKRANGVLDPSGIVKGWAIQNAAQLLRSCGYENFYIDAGGDIQSQGKNAKGEGWSIGVRSPFKLEEVVKVIYPQGAGVATSGSYIRGAHIYNPHLPEEDLNEVVSLTVIGPDILEADRYATAAFAMGKEGIHFIETLPEFEAYEINAKGRARLTSGLSRYLYV